MCPKTATQPPSWWKSTRHDQRQNRAQNALPDGTRRIPDSSMSTAGSFGLSCEAAVLLSILEARDSSCPVEGTESG